MAEKDPLWLRLPWAQFALAGAVLPLAFPGAGQALTTAALAAGAGAAAWHLLRRPPAQTVEDLCSHTWISGLTRSGKSACAILRLVDWSCRGHGWAWLSIKGAAAILPYLPPKATARCDLLAPASPRPRGLNLLRLYTASAQEREQVADQAAALYQRQHAAMSANMLELIRLGALALLHHAQATSFEVTLADLYRLFTRDAYRSKVLQTPGQPWAVLDAFAEAEQSKTGDRTLEAVRRQLRRPVAAEALLVTLARKGPGTIDLRQVMQAGRWRAVDVSDATLGPEQAGFLNQAVAAKLQLLTPARQSDPPLFHIVADEAREFAGSGETLAKAIALTAEYRVAWTLIHQSQAQLAGGLELAAPGYSRIRRP